MVILNMRTLSIEDMLMTEARMGEHRASKICKWANGRFIVNDVDLFVVSLRVCWLKYKREVEGLHHRVINLTT